ncbi:hypothetical protein D3C76_970240 [compost metagenome]
MLADAAGTGEQQVVEGLLAEGVANVRATGDDRHFVFGIDFAEDPRQQRRGFRVVFRHLDHHPVTRGQGTGQSVEDHVPGEVPGRENAHHAQRLILHPGLAAVGGPLVRLHPFGNFGLGILQRCQWPQNIEHAREIGAAMTEVRRQGFDDVVLVIDQQADGPVDQFAALLGRPRLTGKACGTLLVQDHANIGSLQVFVGTHGVRTSMQGWAVGELPIRCRPATLAGSNHESGVAHDRRY